MTPRLLLFVSTALVASACMDEDRLEPFDPRFEEGELPSSSRGELVLSQVALAEGGPATPTTHRTVFVPGESDVEVEDNDIRGFLDGTFKWGWNQPGQIHVRFGRRGEGPQYGEHELFRVLQRWDGIDLPGSARVSGAELSFHVEAGPDYPVEVLLYDVHRDWLPGQGGTQRDNVSPPVTGEVWWNGPRFGEESWGLPGVGHAAANEGDTGIMALASHPYEPGDSLLTFSGSRLAGYVEDRIRAGEPLLFLLKLADLHEDLPGSLVMVYSVNYGDSRNAAHRPELALAWETGGSRSLLRESVLLEHGRSDVSERIPVSPDGWLHAEFRADSGYAHPLVELRGGPSLGDTAAWRRADEPIRNDWRWVQTRLRSFRNPVQMGDTFEVAIHDTWVLTEPSEAPLEIAFQAPSGRVVSVDPEYRGGYRWRVGLFPDEFGTWRYRWRADFAEAPMVSPLGEFEVIATERSQVIQALEELVEDLRAEASATGSIPETRLGFLQRRLLGHERAALRLETPTSFRRDSNEVLALLAEARELLGGVPVPDSIPLVVSPSHQGREEAQPRSR